MSCTMYARWEVWELYFFVTETSPVEFGSFGKRSTHGPCRYSIIKSARRVQKKLWIQNALWPEKRDTGRGFFLSTASIISHDISIRQRQNSINSLGRTKDVLVGVIKTFVQLPEFSMKLEVLTGWFKAEARTGEVSESLFLATLPIESFKRYCLVNFEFFK